MNKKHEGQWRSRIGFLLASASACAGYGVVSDFPGRVAQNGGYRFILVYLGIVILCALSVLPATEAIGRRWRCSMISAPMSIKKEFLPIGLIYFVCAILSGAVAITFASVGLRYFLGFVEEIGGQHGFLGITMGDIVYQGVAEQTDFLFEMAAAVVIVSFVIAVFDVRNGIEIFARLSVPAVMSLLILLAVYGFNVLHLTQQGEGTDAIRYYLMGNDADWSFVHAFRNAGSQAAEGILMGLGVISLYATKTPAHAKSSGDIWGLAFIPVLLAVLSGGAIVPMLQACGMKTGCGDLFLFQDMFDVFVTMGTAGNLLGAMFYLSVIIFCAFVSTSCMKLTAEAVQEFYWMKGQRNLQWLWMLCTGSIMLGISVLILKSSGGLGGTLMKTLRMTAGILAPLGGIAVCVLAGWYMDRETREMAIESGICKWRVKRIAEYMMKYIMPAFLVLLIISEIAFYMGK